MRHDQIVKTFKKVFKGQNNFMTPDVLEYGQRGEYIFEVSKGKGIGGETIYGLTVLGISGEHYHELSGCYHSIKDINEAIAKLKDAVIV